MEGFFSDDYLRLRDSIFFQLFCFKTQEKVGVTQYFMKDGVLWSDTGSSFHLKSQLSIGL